MDKYLISIPELARSLGIGRSLCYELLTERHVAVVKIGRRALIPVAEAERLANELVAEAKESAAKKAAADLEFVAAKKAVADRKSQKRWSKKF